MGSTNAGIVGWAQVMLWKGVGVESHCESGVRRRSASLLLTPMRRLLSTMSDWDRTACLEAVK